MLMTQKTLSVLWNSSYIFLACVLSLKVVYGIEEAESNTNVTTSSGQRLEKKNSAYNAVLEDIFDGDRFRSRGNFHMANHLLTMARAEIEQEKQALIASQAKQADRLELEQRIYRTHLASRIRVSAILRDFLTMRY